MTPLHYATESDIPARVVVETLLEAGADVNAQDDDLQTPLHYATADPSSSLVVLLIQAQANVHARDADGETPLHRATSFATPAVVEALIVAGANTNAEDAEGRTPLHHATDAYEHGHAAVVALIEGGADVNAKDNAGRSPLHCVADASLQGEERTGPESWWEVHYTRDHPAMAAALIDAGGDVNAREERGRTPLDLARTKCPNLAAMVTALVDARIDS